MKILRFVVTRWLATSLPLSMLPVALDSGLLRFAEKDHYVQNEIVDSGMLLIATLALSAQWLLASWVSEKRNDWQNSLMAANAVVTVIVGIVYTAVRVDVLLVLDEAIFAQSAVRTATLFTCIVVACSSLGSAIALATLENGNA